MTLTDFLLARIAEDEAGANATLVDPVARWQTQDWAEIDQPALAHVWRFNPHRVLAECEAKRLIVTDYERYERSGAVEVEGARRGLSMALKALASVYADHPDYREEWKP